MGPSLAVACLRVAAVLAAIAAGGCASAPMPSEKAAKSFTPGPSPALGYSVERSIGRTAAASPTAPAAPRAAAGNAAAPRAAAGSHAAPRVEDRSQAPSPQYRIGQEDILHISVWESKELTLDAVVRPDGKVSVPLIQDVQAEGLTAAELADVIQRKLLAYVKDPQVSVIVTQVNAPKIYVIGNVGKPGPYPLRSDMTVLQALTIAGGFNQFAGRRSIRLVRGVGTKQEVRKLNYYDLIDKGGEGNILLMPGDTIVVP